MGACGVQALLVDLHVMLPVLSLLDVRLTEFPILVRLINTREKALSLFVFGQVEKEFHNPGSVTVEMLLQVHDGPIALLPNAFSLAQSIPEGPGCGESPDALERRVLLRSKSD